MAFVVAFHGCGKNTECTGKSPDPLHLRDSDAIHPVLLIKGSGTETMEIL